MSHNFAKEACELFHIPPAPKELDFDSWAEYLVAKAKHDKTCDQQAMAWERWIEQEKVLELQWEMEHCRQENHILPSLPLYHSFRAPAISLSLIHFLDIFGLRNPWEPELYTIWVRSLRIGGLLILIIIPNGDTILALNSPDSYNS